MTWEYRLIRTYFLVNDYRDVLSACCHRNTNNNHPLFTDEEILTIYLFCSADELKLHSKKEVYIYADRHLRSWFPRLPKYEAFNSRLNQLLPAFVLISNLITSKMCEQNADYAVFQREFVLDSLPIMLAKRQRAFTGNVAKEIASVGYCATKSTWYYGCKFHAAGLVASKKELPLLSAASLTSASTHDNTAFKEDIARNCVNSKIYADSAYFDKAAAPYLLAEFNVTVQPIQKKVRGQKELHSDQKWENTAISRIRQPIEGFFNWLIEKTNIQKASYCRSTKGFLTHINGKIAAAMVFLFINNGFQTQY